MCGLAGFLCGPRASRPDDPAALMREMGDAIVHRGPDDAGYWWDADSGMALVHRRLAILDLSIQGHQPMASSCGRYVVAYNGEIYNFGELRAELAAAGEAFRGHSDTEVLLAAVRRWGMEATLPRLVGMFAFALWDREARRLYLARDRMGEKPLYYGRLGDTFFFASELKALRRHPAWRGERDPGALALYLHYGYVPAPHTIYRGIRKLPAGTWLTLSATSMAAEPVAYWSLKAAALAGEAAPIADEGAALEALDEALRRSIRGQLVADVPVGAFLSGGIDSSLIVALIQAEGGRKVKSFTIGFSEAADDEASEARAVARHLGSEHSELYLSPADALAVVPLLPTLDDEPFADSSQIPTYLVARLARTEVTVALSGDGGDELFGGYHRYRYAADVARWSGRIPRPLRRSAAALLHGAANSPLPAALRRRVPAHRLGRLAELLALDGPDAIFRDFLSVWQGETLALLAGEASGCMLDDPAGAAPIGDPQGRMMYLDQATYLADDILVKVDRAAMAVSLENRAPFLDHRLVELAWRLPTALKIRDGVGKWPLRRLLARYLPPDLIDRPKKGFGLPLGEWLRGGLREWADDLLTPAALVAAGFADPSPIHACWAEHLSGRRNMQQQFWTILAYLAWDREERGR